MSRANPANRGLSAKELAQQQMNVFNAMPPTWLTDEQVNALYFTEFKNRRQSASLYWPGLGDRFLPDQLGELAWQVKNNTSRFLFIPINRNKNHWEFIVVVKDVQGIYQAHRVTTPADGKCGWHTVKQSMEILDTSLSTFATNHPGRVRQLNANDPIYSQIQAVLKVANSTSTTTDANAVPELVVQPETQANQQENRQLQAAITASLKIQRMSPFDYKLAKLAEYEALGYSVENLCKELTQMLVAMSLDNRAFAVSRLRLSGLGGKPSIERIIKAAETQASKPVAAVSIEVPKLSANPNILIPSPKPQKRKDQEIELNSSCKPTASPSL